MSRYSTCCTQIVVRWRFYPRLIAKCNVSKDIIKWSIHASDFQQQSVLTQSLWYFITVIMQYYYIQKRRNFTPWHVNCRMKISGGTWRVSTKDITNVDDKYSYASRSLIKIRRFEVLWAYAISRYIFLLPETVTYIINLKWIKEIMKWRF